MNFFVSPRLFKNQLCRQFLLVMLFNLSYYGLYAQNISKDFLTGRFDYSKDTSFIKVPDRYTNKTVYLKKETCSAFQKMYQAALKAGITLTILSGTRSFYNQKNIWESKWNTSGFARLKNDKQRTIQLLRWRSMPGTSRHHWGTDVDIYNLNPAFYQTAEGKKIYDWLVKNAPKYGFEQPFTAGRTSGYQEEKWHWSYVPLSGIYLKAYLREINYEDIYGFKGANTAKELEVIKNWVCAVSERCKN